MEKSKALLTWMVLLIIATLGSMVLAIVAEAPIFAVLVSFSSLVLNYNIRASIITDL